MTDQSPLYLGFDLSTQQLKGIAVTSDLKVAFEAVFDFDADATGFGVKKGVLTNKAEREVFAPVNMWLQAIDAVLQRLQNQGIDFGRVRGISGAGQRKLCIRSLFAQLRLLLGSQDMLWEQATSKTVRTTHALS